MALSAGVLPQQPRCKRERILRLIDHINADVIVWQSIEVEEALGESLLHRCQQRLPLRAGHDENRSSTGTACASGFGAWYCAVNSFAGFIPGFGSDSPVKATASCAPTSSD